MSVYAKPKNEAERLWELVDKAYKEKRYKDAIYYYEKSLHSAEITLNVLQQTTMDLVLPIKPWEMMKRYSFIMKGQ